MDHIETVGLKGKFILVFVGLLLGIILCEGISWIFLPSPQMVTIESAQKSQSFLENKPRELTLMGMPDFGLYVHTKSGKRLRPNCTARIKNHHISGLNTVVRTNAFGFRGPSLSEPKNKTRILFLGDSITFGDYLPEEEIFVSLLEKISHSTKTPYEVVNAGIGAIGLHTELAILKESVKTVKPDIVILDFYLNDFQPSVGIHVHQPPKLLQWSRSVQILLNALASLKLRNTDYGYVDSKLSELWKNEVVTFLQSKKAHETDQKLNRFILENIRDWGGSWSPSVFEYMKPLLVECQGLSKAHNFKFYMIIFPVSYQVESKVLYDFPQRQIQNLGNELKIQTLDLLPKLRNEYMKKQKSLYFDHCHPNKKGNKLIAGWIFDFLIEINKEIP